jgi:hypothetical protein
MGPAELRGSFVLRTTPQTTVEVGRHARPVSAAIRNNKPKSSTGVANSSNQAGGDRMNSNPIEQTESMTNASVEMSKSSHDNNKGQCRPATISLLAMALGGLVLIRKRK